MYLSICGQHKQGRTGAYGVYCSLCFCSCSVSIVVQHIYRSLCGGSHLFWFLRQKSSAAAASVALTAPQRAHALCLYCACGAVLIVGASAVRAWWPWRIVTQRSTLRLLLSLCTLFIGHVVCSVPHQPPKFRRCFNSSQVQYSTWV